MGFEFRKRTRGSKSGWMNFSYSKKNGFNTSLTVKSGNLTHNFGNRVRRSRTTVNLGNGLRHVSYGTTSNGSGGQIGIFGAIAIMIALFVVVSLVVNYIWWSVGIAVTGWAAYKGYRYIFHSKRKDL